MQMNSKTFTKFVIINIFISEAHALCKNNFAFLHKN